MAARINYILHSYINETRLNSTTIIFAFLIYSGNSGVANVAKEIYFFSFSISNMKIQLSCNHLAAR
jgi:hypothetical protein